MKQYDDIIIGFGKGGKTLAAKLRAKGETVALIEASKEMYGGTCINVACIPSKSLEKNARLSAAIGGSFEEKAKRYRQAIEEKRALTAMLRGKNHDKLVQAGVDVIDGTASFKDARHVLVDGKKTLQAKRVFINTGSRPVLPPISGLSESKHVFTSETMMEQEQLPERFAIIGGGYIGLEFASYYANFGSRVTILQDGDAFIPKEDRDVAQSVLDSFSKRNITVMKGVKITKVHDEAGGVVIETSAGPVEADAVLVATGRRPNVQELALEKAGVKLTERGAVMTDEHLMTNVEGIYAIGDVAGSLQFTYISLDDSRIIASTLAGDGKRTTKNRGAVPYTVFLDPPLSRIGLSEEEAKAAGLEIKTATLPAAAIPKAQVLRQPTGILKVIIGAKTDKILGAHLFCAESYEMINLIKMAMDAGIPYMALRDAIYTHPTMTEAFNDLFSLVQA